MSAKSELLVISKDRVKEISNFIRSFLRVFEGDFTGNDIARDDPKGDAPYYFAFRVNGAVSGCLIGYVKSHLKIRYPSSEQILECYRSITENIQQMSLCNLEIIDLKKSEEIVYTMRRANPEVSIKFETKYYNVHFIVSRPEDFPANNSTAN